MPLDAMMTLGPGRDAIRVLSSKSRT